MTDTRITADQQAETAVQARLKDLEEENELLLLQLHQVQEELESYFLKYRELERSGGSLGTGSASAGGWVDDELPAMQAEVSRLTTLVETQTRLHDIASRNALNARLGDILIQSVSPGGSLIGLPSRLLGIWRASTADQPPARLGGKNFDKVIETFKTGGLEPVSQLLAAEPAPEMRAKAWTALARHQMKSGLFADAALSARRAYEEEPKPYRLKWLAFRLHDAGEIAEADACLSLLPQDTPFSDSEGRQRDQVRYEAKNARLREAKNKTGFEARRQAMENQMQLLRRDCDRDARLAAEREAEIKTLQQAQARLEQEKAVLASQQDASGRLLADRNAEIEALGKAFSALEQEKSTLALQQDALNKFLADRNTEIQALGKACSELEQEKSVLAAQQEASVKLLSERYAEIESLRTTCSRLEQERLAISRQRIESSLLLSEREAEIRILNETRVRLEQQLLDLVTQSEESTKLAEVRLGEIETLSQGLKDIEQEKAGLAAQLEESARLSAELQAKIDSLRQVEGKFEQERSELKKTIEDLTRQRDEQSRLAQDRVRQIAELQRETQEREAAETELATRQEIIRSEMVRAEAQLDLLKEILLREQGL